MIDSEKFFLIGDPSQKSQVNETISSPVSLRILVEASKVTVKGSIPTIHGFTITLPITSALLIMIGILFSDFAPLCLSSMISFAS